MQIDSELQRRRLLANRETGARGDVIDDVIAEHVASFEPPTADELPILLAAADTGDARRLAEVVSAIRST